MGRKKSYDRQEAAAAALKTFWERGYSQTSLKDLEQATGVNRYGLYDSFTDKEGLFAECIDQYRSEAAARFELLAEQGLDGLIGMFHQFAEPEPDNMSCRHGCLVVAALTERNALPEGLRRRLDEHVEALMTAIRGVLQQEREAGKLRDGIDLDECAEFIHLSLVGLPTMVRISTDASSLQLAARSVTRTIESWRRPSA